jgi:hypothetical protein
MLSKNKMAERVVQLTGERPAQSEWLTCHEAALFCNVSLGTFRNRVMRRVHCKRLGRRIMVQRASLEGYFDALETHKPKTLPRRKKAAAKG